MKSILNYFLASETYGMLKIGKLSSTRALLVKILIAQFGDIIGRYWTEARHIKTVLFVRVLLFAQIIPLLIETLRAG